MRKTAAGAINFNAFRLLQRARQSGAFNATELRDIMQIHTALNEQFLSPKNEKGVGNLNFINQIQDVLSDLYSAAGQNDEQVKQDAYDKAVSVFDKLLSDRKELTRLNPIYKKDEAGNLMRDAFGNYIDEFEGNAEGRRRRAIETVASFAKRVDMRGVNELAERGGTSRKGLKSGAALTEVTGSDNAIQQSLHDVNSVEQKLYGDNVSASVPGATPLQDIDTDTTPLNKSAIPVDNTTTAPSISSRGATVKSMPSLGKKLQRFSKIGGIKGLVAGVGAGLLISGYGSSPATPASTQAQGGYEETEQVSPGMAPSLADPGLSMQAGNAPSYVINISGNSPQGQAQAVNAVNVAISSQVPMSTSINVQMNTSYADKISQFQIDKLVGNSLFT